MSPHSAPHIHAHLVSALNEAGFAAESFGRADRLHTIQHAIYEGGAEVCDGMVRLSEAPGFGVEIDWKAVATFKA